MHSRSRGRPMSLFVCRECGSAALSMPRELTDDAPVHCSACKAPRGTWGDLRDIAAELIAMEQQDPRKPRLSWASADPLPSFSTIG